MRIVAGAWKGRRLKAPEGRDTRPTSDRVREAMFSAVVARVGSLEGMRVLDLFAGSGALGLEALSRGAASLTFVESDPRAVAVIRGNLRELGARESAAVVLVGRAERLVDAIAARGPFSLLLADPPYRIDAAQVRELLETLACRGAIGHGGVVVYEHAAGVEPEWPAAFVAGAEKRYGDTGVSFAMFGGMGEE